MNEFIKSNADMGMIIKNVKCVELNTKIVGAAFNTHTLKMMSYYTNVCVAIGITKKN